MAQPPARWHKLEKSIEKSHESTNVDQFVLEGPVDPQCPEEATSPGRNSPERQTERVAPVAGLQLGHGMETPWNLGTVSRLAGG